MRWITAGESHGQALSAIIEGMPAHVSITTHDIDFHLARRRLGVGRGARQNFEADKVSILGGVRLGVTQGGPISVQVGNSEWPKWEKVMSADPVPADEIENLARNAPLSRPRPGHADLVGMQKYDFDDARPILERASARETAARVALGAIARNFLEQAIGITILSHVVSIGSVRIPDSYSLPAATDMNRIDEDPVRCTDPATSALMIAEIEQCAKDGDSLGGIVEVLAYGLPVGLGSHVHWDRKLDALLAQAMMSIQAVKGVEIGDGFEVAGRRGSLAHDPIHWDEATQSFVRAGSLSGGTEGGMTTGELLVVRAAMKPLATLNKPTLPTVDVITKEAGVSFKERTDVTAVPAMGVVGETMVALVLAAEAQRKFGGDSVAEFVRNAISAKESTQQAL